MTHDEFIKWLDEEIAETTKFRKNEEKEPEFNYWLGASDALECVKRKLTTPTPPPTNT